MIRYIILSWIGIWPNIFSHIKSFCTQDNWCLQKGKQQIIQNQVYPCSNKWLSHSLLCVLASKVGGLGYLLSVVPSSFRTVQTVDNSDLSTESVGTWSQGLSVFLSMLLPATNTMKWMKNGCINWPYCRSFCICWRFLSKPTVIPLSSFVIDFYYYWNVDPLAHHR